MPKPSSINSSSIDQLVFDSASLRLLQQVLETEIPMAASMGVRVDDAGDRGDGLSISMPLERNRNHQQTAFAGSLNALCTLAGWGMTYLQLQQIGKPGVIVIRRSSIKYHRPVDCHQVQACCEPLSNERREYFQEMLETKGQSKLDLEVTITPTGDEDADRPAVAFTGSYVVLPPNAS